MYYIIGLVLGVLVITIIKIIVIIKTDKEKHAIEIEKRKNDLQEIIKQNKLNTEYKAKIQEIEDKLLETKIESIIDKKLQELRDDSK